MTLHMNVALKSQYLFVVSARPFPTNQNVKYGYFCCAFQLFHIFAGSVHKPMIKKGRWGEYSMLEHYKTTIYQAHLILINTKINTRLS